MTTQEDFKTIKIEDWAIPETEEVSDYPRIITDKQLESVTLLIWHEYLLHDEINAALKFIEDAPYRIKHSTKIMEAIKLNKKMLGHIGNVVEDQGINVAKLPNGIPYEKEIIPLPQKLTGQVYNRYSWVLNRLYNKSWKVLDFGPNDGTLTNRWALEGYDITAVDLSELSLKVARKAAQEHNTGAKFINCYFSQVKDHLPQHSFDVATCTDCYEHLKDPVNDLLIPAREMLNGNGKMLLATPHGSWMRGKFVAFAHPWVTADKVWVDGPRGHVIAPTVWTVVENFRKAGFWVYECRAVYTDIQDVPEQGNVCIEAYANPPMNYPEHEFIFTGWDKLELANNLAAAGNYVKVYRNHPEECVLGFVEYRQMDKLKLEDDNKKAIRVNGNNISYYIGNEKIEKVITENEAQRFLLQLK